MITWKDDFNGWVRNIICVRIIERIDGLFDVTIAMLGGNNRQLCSGTIDDAHETAERLCAIELPSVHV